MKQTLTPLSEVARLYCPCGLSGRRRVTLQQSIRAFHRELQQTFSHYPSLAARLRRHGWKGRGFTPDHLRIIRERLGDVCE